MSFDDLLKESESVPAGSEGLQFLPYLSGERTPYPDPLARGAWVGLTLRHGRGHLTRAVLEGVSFGLKDVFNLICEAGLGEIKQVRASGGGTKGALWRQILASALEAELVTINTTEGAALGAALLAGVGAGNWADVPTACAKVVQITGSTRPDPAQMEVYRQAYPCYRQLYPSLKPTFDKILP
jgi:xylulokinase